jgi:hypothetical protein
MKILIFIIEMLLYFTLGGYNFLRKRKYTRFCSSMFAFIREYMATPAIAIAVPMPVCVEILLPAEISKLLE